MVKEKKRGIPKEILRELDIKTKDKKIPSEIMVTMEEHQSKLTIPANIKLEMNLKKGQKFNVIYDKEKKELIYKLK